MDFPEQVFKFQEGNSSNGILMAQNSLVEHVVKIMEAVVANPERLFQLAFHAKNGEKYGPSKASKEMPSSPMIASLFTSRNTVKNQGPPPVVKIRIKRSDRCLKTFNI